MLNPSAYLERQARPLAATLALYCACAVLRRPELARRVYLAAYGVLAGALCVSRSS
jgi:hypothetical protein